MCTWTRKLYVLYRPLELQVDARSLSSPLKRRRPYRKTCALIRWDKYPLTLYPQAIATLLHVAEDIRNMKNKAAVVVGSTQSDYNGQVNHGGIIVNGSWWNTNLVVPGDRPISCDTLNGNCVLIAKCVAHRIGNLDSLFIHTMGDIGYGFRVRAVGFPLVVVPGFARKCQSNPITNTYEDDTLPLRERLSKIADIKGRPLKPWFIFLWRHFGWLGLFYWTGTYVKVVLTSLRTFVRSKMQKKSGK